MKTLVTILLASFLPALAWAQGPLLWDKTLGGSGWDEPHSVVATPDGGCIVAGHSSGSGISGDKTDICGCITGMWAVRLDGRGNKVWDKSFGGRDRNYAFDIINTADDNYLLIGFSDSDKGGDKSEDRKGSNDFWIVKIDGDGNKLWDKTYGGARDDVGYAGIATPDGGFLIAGNSSSGSESDKSEASKGSYDYWVLKIDADGNKLWDRTLGGSDYEECHSLAATTDGGYVLGGLSRSDKGEDKTEDHVNSYDGWVVKIDAGGNKLWDRTVGSFDPFYRKTSIAATPDGGCLFSANNGFIPIKLAADGDVQWEKNYTVGFCNSYALIRTGDGNYVLAGSNPSDKRSYKSEDSRGGTDFWMIRMDAAGNLKWDKTLGGKGGDDCHAVVETSDKGLILVGRTESDSSGDKTEQRRGGVDYWVVKLGPVPTPLQWRNLLTRAASTGTPDGVVRMAAYGGKEPYEYSIDDGANWQSGRSFGDLPAGAHKAAVRDASGAVIHADVWLRER